MKRNNEKKAAAKEKKKQNKEKRPINAHLRKISKRQKNA